jgi:hypothetical protein
VLAAVARCFFSETLDALGFEPDAKYAELDPPLRDALAVGRPSAWPEDWLRGRLGAGRCPDQRCQRSCCRRAIGDVTTEAI